MEKAKTMCLIALSLFLSTYVTSVCFSEELVSDNFKTVYLKNGGLMECGMAWQEGDTFFVKIRCGWIKDQYGTVQLPLESINVEKTYEEAKRVNERLVEEEKERQAKEKQRAMAYVTTVPNYSFRSHPQIYYHPSGRSAAQVNSDIMRRTYQDRAEEQRRRRESEQYFLNQRRAVLRNAMKQTDAYMVPARMAGQRSQIESLQRSRRELTEEWMDTFQ